MKTNEETKTKTNKKNQNIFEKYKTKNEMDFFLWLKLVIKQRIA